ncbi:MAG: DUF1330 domain-containing protein [Myxococcota bacterium]
MVLVSSWLLGCTAAAEDVRLTFDDAKMYEVAMFTVKAGEADALAEKYFAKVIPVAQEYGMRPLASFDVTHQEHGQPHAATWAFFEWPSVEAKTKFEADKRYQRLKPQRDRRLDTLKLVYTQVAEDTSVTLRSDRLYEFFAGWINAHNGSHLPQYFASAGPFIGSRGVKFIGDFKVVGSSDPEFLPSTVGFIEWPDRSVKEAWFASEEFEQNGWHRALAIDRLVVLEGKVRQPGR